MKEVTKMGLLQKLTNIFRMPKMQDLTDAPGQVKESLQRSKMNIVDVILLDHDFKAGDQVSGIKDRMGKIPIIKIKTPSNLAFFEVSNFFNRTTGKETIVCVEDNPYSLDMNREILEQQRNSFASGDIGIEGYQLPILLNRLPYSVIKTDTNIQMNNISDEEILELSPSLLHSLAEAKLAKDVTDEDTSVVPVTLLIGIFLGMALLAIIQAFSA